MHTGGSSGSESEKVKSVTVGGRGLGWGIEIGERQPLRMECAM